MPLPGRFSVLIPLIFSVIGMAHPVDADIKPEVVGKVESIGDGPFLLASEYDKSHVISPEGFRYLGMISEATQRVISKDHKQLYTTRTFYDRGREGAKHDTVRVWNIDTLTPDSEVDIENKVAMSGPQSSYMAASSTDKWLFILNATPAVSVTVFDTQKGAQVAEIPIPGCWGIYPIADQEDRFTTLCGDGRMTTVTLTPEGKLQQSDRSDKIFDVDTDPLFMHAERDGNTLYLISFHGNLYSIDVSGDQAVLLSKHKVEDKEDPDIYKPSGYQLMSFIPNEKSLYILMQEKPWEGSHVEPANELWVYDVTTNKLRSRSTVQDALSIMFVPGAKNAVFVGTKDNGLIKYVADEASNYTVRRDKSMKMDRITSLLLVQ